MDEQAQQRTFKQLFEGWINPELRRRFGDAGPPQSFKIYQCLIRLPNQQSPIVEFNDEIAWDVSCKMPPNLSFKYGDPVHLHEIERIDSVMPPSHSGKRVAFFYLFRAPPHGYRLIFDASPNWPGQSELEDTEKWKLSVPLADHLNSVLVERIVIGHDKYQAALASIGIWAIPSLMPYPLNQCVNLVHLGRPEEARSILTKYCSPDWLEAQLDRWQSVPELAERRTLITQALAAHRAGQFTLTIHALIPQLEGILTDWIACNFPLDEIPFRQESKIRKLRDCLLDDENLAFTFRRIVESTVDFFLNGPVLESFKKWADLPSDAFPNRHLIGHGKFVEGLYSEENSIKAFLLMDTMGEILRRN